MRQRQRHWQLVETVAALIAAGGGSWEESHSWVQSQPPWTVPLRKNLLVDRARVVYQWFRLKGGGALWVCAAPPRTLKKCELVILTHRQGLKEYWHFK